MARLPRLYAPQIPQLVQARFAHPLAQAADPSPAAALDQLLVWLQEGAHEHKVAVHGWSLLNDRLTILATPSTPDGLPKLVQGLGRRFATRLQPGRVFAERYRSALIEPGRWVLPALVWLESLPVRHHYVERAESWPWSSAAGHTGINVSAGFWPTDHPDYWKDGNTPFDRQAKYRQRLSNGLTPTQNQKIEDALFGQWALGDASFLARLARHASRRLVPAPRGRPKKSDENTDMHGAGQFHKS